MTHNKKM